MDSSNKCRDGFVYIADIDGDGDLDIICRINDDSVTIAWYENNGAANPTWTTAYHNFDGLNQILDTSMMCDCLVQK